MKPKKVDNKVDKRVTELKELDKKEAGLRTGDTLKAMHV